jgi:hypothetical protein
LQQRHERCPEPRVILDNGNSNHRSGLRAGMPRREGPPPARAS